MAATPAPTVTPPPVPTPAPTPTAPAAPAADLTAGARVFITIAGGLALIAALGLAFLSSAEAEERGGLPKAHHVVSAPPTEKFAVQDTLAHLLDT